MDASDLPRQYRYQYRLNLGSGSRTHSYELIGKYGGVQLRITEYRVGAPCGDIEIHYRNPRQDDHRPPTHDACWLIKAPCWHDGSTLWTTTWVPLWEDAGGEHAPVFQALANAADEKFAMHARAI